MKLRTFYKREARFWKKDRQNEIRSIPYQILTDDGVQYTYTTEKHTRQWLRVRKLYYDAYKAIYGELPTRELKVRLRFAHANKRTLPKGNQIERIVDKRTVILPDTFNLTFHVYELFTTSEPGSTAHSDLRPINQIDFPAVDVAMTTLISTLDNLPGVVARKDEKDNIDSYWANYVEKFENKYGHAPCHASIEELLEQLAGDLFYFSDRWCVERVNTVKIMWDYIKQTPESGF